MYCKKKSINNRKQFIYFRINLKYQEFLTLDIFRWASAVKPLNVVVNHKKPELCRDPIVISSRQ